MPKLSEKSKKNKSAYDVEYARDNVVRKVIPFNKRIPEDSRMLDWLDTKQNVTRYVKELIQDDMTGR